MADKRAVGSAPVAFQAAGGRQIVIPLAAISFDDTNKVKTSFLLDSAAENAKLLRWLQFLSARGFLTPGKTEASPPPLPSMVLEAAAPGVWGNDVSISVAPNAGKFNVTASLTEVYTGLKVATAKDRLVADAAAHKMRGLVTVKSPPGTGIPQAGVVPVDAAGATPTWKIMNQETPAKVALTLEAAHGIKALKKVEVLAVDDEEETFTLSLEWEHTVFDVAPAALPNALDPLQVAVKAVAPSSGFKAPKPGDAKLSGGRSPMRARITLYTE